LLPEHSARTGHLCGHFLIALNVNCKFETRAVRRRTIVRALYYFFGGCDKLLNEIIEAATDTAQTVTSTLRRCLILAFQLKNENLKAWVNGENWIVL
jgi:hypothetical protein